ncbi:MAG: hypothetical protein GY820_47005 [Gammaproteobacteria bacterium]|nr:hypothetical protein [Gammaproteobacteria bacterium]
MNHRILGTGAKNHRILGTEHAAYAGDAIMLWTCRKVNASRVIYDHQVGTTCYEYRPVYVKDQLYFVAPGTRDLITTSPTVDCTHRVTPVHQVHGAWVSTSGPQQVQRIEPHGPSDVKPLHFTFQASAVFHSHANREPFTISMLRETVHKLQKLQYGFHRLVNYTADLALDPAALKAQLTGLGVGVGLAMEHSISGIGEAAGHYVEHTTTGLATAAHRILSEPIQLLVNTVAGIAIIALLAFGAYLLIINPATWKMIKRLAQRVACQRKSGEAQAEKKRATWSWLRRQSVSQPVVAFSKGSPKISSPTATLAMEMQQLTNVLQKAVPPKVSVLKLDSVGALTMTGKINHREVDMLFDTGSAVNVISPELVTNCGIRLPTGYCSIPRPQVQMADGTYLDTFGQVIFTVVIDGYSYHKIRAFVAPIHEPDLILGTSFMAQQLRSFTVTFTGGNESKLQLARRFSPILHPSLQVKQRFLKLITGIQQMPPELLELIFHYLPPGTLGRCRRMCQCWYTHLKNGKLADCHPIHTITIVKDTVYQSILKQTEIVRPNVVELLHDNGTTLYFGTQDTLHGHQQLITGLSVLLGANLTELHLGELLPWKNTGKNCGMQRQLAANLISTVCDRFSSTLERVETYELVDTLTPLPIMPKLTHLNIRHYELSPGNPAFLGPLTKSCPKLQSLEIGHLFCTEWTTRNLGSHIFGNRMLYEPLAMDCPDLTFLDVDFIDCRATIEFPIEQKHVQDRMLPVQHRTLNWPATRKTLTLVETTQLSPGEPSSFRTQDHILGNVQTFPNRRQMQGQPLGPNPGPPINLQVPLTLSERANQWKQTPTDGWIARTSRILNKRERSLRNVTN